LRDGACAAIIFTMKRRGVGTGGQIVSSCSRLPYRKAKLVRQRKSRFFAANWVRCAYLMRAVIKPQL